MKSPLFLSVLKAALWVIPLAIYFGSPTVAPAGNMDPLSPGPVRPGNMDYRTELPHGSLKVYSATNEVRDGDAWYFPHSSYLIYTTDGKLFRSIKNQRSPSDEIPEIVPLPVGTYSVRARSENRGYIRTLVVIKEAQQTVLDLDLWESPTPGRLAHD